MTNKIQKNYILAKAMLKTLEQQADEIERKYIRDNNILNDNGTTPNLIPCIGNKETFNKANKEVSQIVESSGLWNKILEARESLKSAEEKLIEYGLSIVPVKEKAILTKAVKENYTIRLKVIEFVLKLDVSTVS